LAHTVGANGVFVEFAVAADAVRQHGGSDLLAEWRSAAACERRHCKPDGYGCYVRDGVPYGFFVEYDRGTERARKCWLVAGP
jgi:Replication-relaxation